MDYAIAHRLFLLSLCVWRCAAIEITTLPDPPLDSILKHGGPELFDEYLCVDDPETFLCKWISPTGDIVDSATRPGIDYLQVAGTTSLDPAYHQVGTEVIRDSVRDMAALVYATIAANGRVGLFTDEDNTTIFPEYEHLQDTPECADRCDNECAVTCTSDGRKYDELAGVGGVRATCVDDNYMCLPTDTYNNSYSVLMHEWGHTVHQYGLDPKWTSHVFQAYQNAVAQEIWDLSSYGMTNVFEYFAEGTGVYFNVNFHPTSSGGMNSCGRPDGFCESEEEARTWLLTQDPSLYEALLYIWSNGDITNEGGLTVCPQY